MAPIFLGVLLFHPGFSPRSGWRHGPGGLTSVWRRSCRPSCLGALSLVVIAVARGGRLTTCTRSSSDWGWSSHRCASTSIAWVAMPVRTWGWPPIFGWLMPLLTPVVRSRSGCWMAGCALSINLWRLVSIAVWTRSARWNRIWLSHSLGVSQSNAFEATLWVRHLRLCPLGGDGTLCPLGGLRNPLWAPHSWRLVDFGMPILALRLLPRFHLLSAWTHLRGGVCSAWASPWSPRCCGMAI